MADVAKVAASDERTQAATSTSYSAEVPMTHSAQRRSWRQLGWSCWQSMCHAWACFDRVAGWLLGLDVPKYEWAILEHRRLLREEEDAVMNGSGVRQQAKQADALERQGDGSTHPTDAPQQVAMAGYTAREGKGQ